MTAPPISDVLPHLLAGAAAAGFINGLAGFGTALFALGFFLTVMDPIPAVAVILVISVVAGLQGLWLVRRAIATHLGRLMQFLIPALFGIPLGVWLLSYLEPSMLKLLIAGFLLLYGGFFSFRNTLPQISRPFPIIDASIGFAGGILGGAASLSGALPTMWCALRGWPKDETRAVLQPFNVTILGVTACIFAVRGAYDRQTLIYLAIALPVAIVAAQGGIWLFKRLPDALFRRLLVSLCFVSGAVLAIRELF